MGFVPENQDYRSFTAVMGPEAYWEAGNYNLFMMCEKPDTAAFRPLGAGFTFRPVRPEELGLWKETAAEPPFIPDVSAYFDRVYAGRQADFFRLLELPKRLGLSLNEHFIMTPSKSVTAVIGISAEPKKSFRKCRNCGRIDCPFRREG